MATTELSPTSPLARVIYSQSVIILQLDDDEVLMDAGRVRQKAEGGSLIYIDLRSTMTPNSS